MIPSNQSTVTKQSGFQFDLDDEDMLRKLGYLDLPNINNEQGRLENVFNSTNTAFDTQPFAKKLNDSLQQQTSVGQMFGNNTARNFLAQSDMAGGQGTGIIGANLLRAQTQLGTQASVSGQSLEGQKYIDQQTQEKVAQQTQIASTLASLQSNYINTLAGYNANKAQTSTSLLGLSQSSSQFERGFDFDREKFDYEKARDVRPLAGAKKKPWFIDHNARRSSWLPLRGTYR